MPVRVARDELKRPKRRRGMLEGDEPELIETRGEGWREDPAETARRVRGRDSEGRDRAAAAGPVPHTPRGRKKAPRDRLTPLHIPAAEHLPRKAVGASPGRQKAVLPCSPVSSVPPDNPSASLSVHVADLATPSIHKDEGLIQARKSGSKAFRVK